MEQKITMPTVTINHAEQLFCEPFSLSLKTLIILETEPLCEASNRISILLSKFHNKSFNPSDHEERLLSYIKISEKKRWKYIDACLVADCVRLHVIKEAELNTITRKDREDINIILLEKCFMFAQKLSRSELPGTLKLILLSHACHVLIAAYQTIIKVPLPENMLKKFIVLGHHLIAKTNEEIGYCRRDLKNKKVGKIGGDVSTRLPGLVAAIKEFRKKSDKTSKRAFINFLSRKEYKQKTPYQIDCYDLYVDDGYIYHRDRTKKNKNGKSKLKWDRPIKIIPSLDRYFYYYIFESIEFSSILPQSSSQPQR